jgi:hypothetical protein
MGYYLETISNFHSKTHIKNMRKAIKNSLNNTNEDTLFDTMLLNSCQIALNIRDEMKWLGYEIECVWIYNQDNSHDYDANVYIRTPAKWSSFKMGGWFFDIAM